MRKSSENKGKYYFLLNDRIFYSDTNYKYKLSLKGDLRFKNFFEIFLFLDENTYDSIITIWTKYSNYTYINIEKFNIIVYDLYNKLTYLYYGCYFESVGDNQISIHSDYMEAIEDSSLLKSSIRKFKLNELIN